MADTKKKNTINVLVTGSNGQLGKSLNYVKKKSSIYNLIFTSKKKLDITNYSKVENFLKRKKIKIHNIYNYFNNLTTTDEIARFIDFLIKKKISTKGTFNFACTKPIKIKDLIYSSKKIMNSSSEIEIIKKTKKKSFEISTKKLQKRFKFLTKPTKVIVEKYLKNLIHEKRNA